MFSKTLGNRISIKRGRRVRSGSVCPAFAGRKRALLRIWGLEYWEKGNSFAAFRRVAVSLLLSGKRRRSLYGAFPFGPGIRRLLRKPCNPGLHVPVNLQSVGVTLIHRGDRCAIKML